MRFICQSPDAHGLDGDMLDSGAAATTTRLQLLTCRAGGETCL